MSDNFILDTKNMDSIIQNLQEIGKMMSELKNDLRLDIVNYSCEWQGRGKTMFDRKYVLVLRQLDDMSEDIYEMAEELLTAAEAYIQFDTDSAKDEDGKRNRY